MILSGHRKTWLSQDLELTLLAFPKLDLAEGAGMPR
jgi:hypothetical protein